MEDVNDLVEGIGLVIDGTESEGIVVQDEGKEEKEEEEMVTVSRKKLEELRSLLLSTKAEVSRLNYNLQMFRNKHNRQMEHIRFLVKNRLNAREDEDDEILSKDTSDSAKEPTEASSKVEEGEGEEEQLTRRQRRRQNKRKGEKKQGEVQVKQGESNDSTWVINQHADWKEDIKPIGYLRSCFKRKNGTPRQGNLCPDSVASLKVIAFPNSEHCLEGLENYSHAWVLFYFHLNDNVAIKPKIRPPKLNGDRIGVMATRSPHRPNPIGLSLVEISHVEHDTVFFNGIDLVDGTPILDVKPYIPFYDYPDTPVRVAPWVEDARSRELNVVFSEEALGNLQELDGVFELYKDIDSYKNAVSAILRADPRSSYRRTKCEGKSYAFTFDRTDVHVEFTGNDLATVVRINKYQKKKEKQAGHLSELLDTKEEES